MSGEKISTSESNTPNVTEWDSLMESDKTTFTRPEVAKLTGASLSKVRKEFIRLKENGEEISTIANEKKQLIEAITREQFELIKERLTPLQLPPDEAITLNEFAKELRVSPDTIRREIAPVLGLNLGKFRNQSENGKGGAIIYIASDQQAEIRDYIENRHREQMPDGYVPAVDVAEELGASEASVIARYFEKNGEPLKSFWLRGRNTRCLSQSQYENFKHYWDETHKDIERIPDGSYKTVQQFANEMKVSINTIRDRFGACSSEVRKYIYDNQQPPADCLSKEQQQEIREDLEKSNQGISKAENTIGYYLHKNGFVFQQSFRPDWMKNPNTGRNLELDYYVNPPGLGIEYDGGFFHKDIDRDMFKDSIARQSGVRIVHVREFGCPEAPEDMLHINRAAKDDDSDFSKVIITVLQMFGINSPDVDVRRDKSEIFEYMRNLARKSALNGNSENIVQ